MVAAPAKVHGPRYHLGLGAGLLLLIALDMITAAVNHTTAIDGGVLDLFLLIGGIYELVKGWRQLPHPLLSGDARASLLGTWLAVALATTVVGAVAWAHTWGMALFLAGFTLLMFPLTIAAALRIGKMAGQDLATVTHRTPTVAELQSQAWARLGRALTPEEITAFYTRQHAEQHQAALNLGVLAALVYIWHRRLP